MSTKTTDEHDDASVMRPRSFRCDDPTWDDAVRIANERGDNISEMLRATLRRYAKRHGELS